MVIAYMPAPGHFTLPLLSATHYLSAEIRVGFDLPTVVFLNCPKLLNIPITNNDNVFNFNKFHKFSICCLPPPFIGSEFQITILPCIFLNCVLKILDPFVSINKLYIICLHKWLVICQISFQLLLLWRKQSNFPPNWPNPSFLEIFYAHTLGPGPSIQFIAWSVFYKDST